MSYAEFLDWCDEDTRAGWVDGEVISASPASAAHRILVGFLLKVLDTHAEQHELGQVIAAPFQMKAGPELPGREPDLLFIARENLDRLEGVHLDGPSDLAIEVVSPVLTSKSPPCEATRVELAPARTWCLRCVPACR